MPALLLLLLVLVVPAQAAPRPGSLDPSFGDNGKVLPELAPTFLQTEFTGLARLSDGSLILSANRENRRAEIEGAIERRGPRGNLDPGFGEGGIFSASDVSAFVAGPDGGVLFASRTGNTCRSASEVHRLAPGGRTDARFGSNGTSAEVPLDVEEIAFAPDGGIVLTGQALEGHCGRDLTPQGVLALARLRPDGSLDPGFGRGGVVIANRDLGRPDGAPVGLAVEASGRIVVASFSAILALTPSGSLDPGFGGGGVVEAPGAIRTILAAPLGGVYVAALSSRSCCNEPGDYRLARYRPDGSLDPAYGSGGIATLDVAAVDEPTALALAPDGGVILAGQSSNSDGCPVACENFVAVLARFTTAGQLDSGFGEGGWLVAATPVYALNRNASPRITALAATPEGRILAAGGTGTGDAFILGREASGAADTSFGRLGEITEFRKAPSASEAGGVAIEPNDHILLTGRTDARVRSTRPVLFNFEPDGRPDRDLGSGAGFLPTAAEGPIAAGGPNELFALRGDGERSYVVRVGNRGRTDHAYGSEGEARLPADLRPRSLLARPDGRVLVLGSYRHPFGMAAYRLDPRGRPDRRFGHRGLVVVSFGRHVSAEARGALLEPGGRILLFGAARATAAAARLLPSGRLDRSFGHRGRFSGFLGHGTRAILGAPAPGGGALLASLRESNAGGGTLVVRLGPDGRRGPRFGAGGVLLVPGAQPPLALFGSPRRFVVLGPHSLHGQGGVLLRRYRADGSVDRRFGNRGIAVAAVGQRRPFVPVAAARDRRGRIVVAGSAGTEEFERSLELLRFR